MSMTCHRGGTALLPSGGTGTTPAGCSSARHRERPRAAGGVAASGPHWSASDGCGRIPRLGQLQSGERECGAAGTWSVWFRRCAALTASTTQSPTRVAKNGTSTKPTTPQQDQSRPLSDLVSGLDADRPGWRSDLSDRPRNTPTQTRTSGPQPETHLTVNRIKGRMRRHN